MTTYRIAFPPTTGNHQHGSGKGRVWLLKAIKDYRLSVMATCRGPVRTHNPKGPVDVIMRACPPSNHKRDHDNVEKVVNDALVQAKVIADDSDRVCRGHVFRWLRAGEDNIMPGEIEVVILDVTGRSE